MPPSDDRPDHDFRHPDDENPPPPEMSFTGPRPPGGGEGTPSDNNGASPTPTPTPTPTPNGRRPPPARPLGKAGRFEILRHLGSGGMGDVWVAADLHVGGREVAYKVIQDRWKETAARVKQFYREAALTDLVKHPGVVPIVDVLVDGDGRPAYVMELLNGEMLNDVIARHHAGTARVKGVLPTPRGLLSRLIEVARVVDGAHRLDPPVVHADLKPNNVMVDDLGATRVLDWGSAYVIGPDDGSGASRTGTPGYYDEATKGQPPTVARDVFALGATLAKILTDSPVGNLKGAGARRELQAIAERARARSGSYPSAAAFADDLQRFLDGEHVEADVNEPRFAVAWRWVNRHPTGVTAAVLTTVLLFFAGLTVQGMRVSAAQWVAGVERDAALKALVGQARATARRGDWSGALGEYREAIAGADDGPLALGLRIERLPGFLAVNEMRRMGEELDELAGRNDLGPLKPRVDLARATYLLCDMNTREQGVAAAREALKAAAPGALPGADRAFAEALVRTSPREALARLDDAVRLDPFHVNAQNARLVVLLVMGELKHAREEAGRLQKILPAATLPPIALALIDLCEGDRESADAHLDELAGALGPRRAGDVDRLREHCRHFGNFMDIVSRFDPLPAGVLDVGKLAFESAWLKISYARGIPLDLPVPTLGLLVDEADRLAEATGIGLKPYGRSRPLTVAQLFRPIEVLAGVVPNNAVLHGDDAVPRLEAIRAEFPEATFSLLLAMNRMNRAGGLMHNAKAGQARPLFAEISRLCEETIDSPTLLPRSPMLYKARVVGAVVDLSYLRMTPEPDPKVFPRLCANLHALVAEGERHPRQRTEGLSMLIKLYTLHLDDFVLAEWPGGDRRELKQRERLLGGYMLTLARDWLAADPENATARENYDQMDRLVAGGGRDDPAKGAG